MFAFCARRVGRTDAADATSDVFAVVWRRIDEVPIETGVAWIFGVARGIVLNRWRSRKRQGRLRERLRGIREPGPQAPDAVVVQQEETTAVLAALDRLPARDQDILIMSAWDELTGPEIASILGISVAAVDQRIHRAKKRLARSFKEPAATPLRLGDVESERGEA